MAKDVSIRLHNELDTVEKKRSRLEQENEELQVKLQDLEVAKQVLQAELEKSREVGHKPGFWNIQYYRLLVYPELLQLTIVNNTTKLNRP